MKANTGIPSYALTVPMALRVAFLSMAAMSSTKSSEVDHGSKQVVIMYFTPSVFLGVKLYLIIKNKRVDDKN